MSEYDFNDAANKFPLIPGGTLAKVLMYIKHGQYDNPDLGLTGGIATQSPKTGSVYLKVGFQILEGDYAHLHVFGMIGMYSPNGGAWRRKGREFISLVLCSARGVSPQDNSEKAKAARKIESYADLDGIIFIARIDVEFNKDGKESNVIKLPITCDHQDYRRLMGSETNVKPSARNNFLWAG